MYYLFSILLIKKRIYRILHRNYWITTKEVQWCLIGNNNIIMDGNMNSSFKYKKRYKYNYNKEMICMCGDDNLTLLYYK